MITCVQTVCCINQSELISQNESNQQIQLLCCANPQCDSILCRLAEHIKLENGNLQRSSQADLIYCTTESRNVHQPDQSSHLKYGLTTIT